MTNKIPMNEMDEAAFEEALEAYWEADGGTYGGVRAAILKYLELVDQTAVAVSVPAVSAQAREAV